MRRLVIIAALALSGCAGGLNSTTATRAAADSKLTQAQRTHEYPAATPHQRASGASPGPIAAIRAFATAFINWNAATLAADMRALAAESIGQARAAMQLAGADTAQDYELQRGGIANSGTVEAVALLRGSRDRYAVVTLERTTASNTTAYQGLRPAWHVTIATVVETGPGLWVVSGWQPET